MTHGTGGPLVLLHTSPVHVPVFDALRDRHHPGLGLRHLVHEGLLDRARAEGPEAVADEVGGVLARAVAEGAGAVLCTCSTLGAVAEARAEELGVPVLRVDRPMAAAAMRSGRPVVIVAALPSTVRPTLDLLREESADTDGTTFVGSLLVPEAWERFEAGDRDGYLDAVAAAVDGIAPAEGAEAPVVVLAQASMADAAARVRTPLTVLSSPGTGLAAAAEAAGYRPE
ncbi:aspartate/glutamate racemase family protein [Streptomyces sp. NPDC094032]|uniref:aspartate/glutamate racemase family protein n=1 Tax=Streptomyces sp. NPDC094032 TaxID=3155308 RepID=UPI00331925A8